jgi:hypothetical protein
MVLTTLLLMASLHFVPEPSSQTQPTFFSKFLLLSPFFFVISPFSMFFGSGR